VEGLGRLFDVGLGWAPVDLDTADGATGKRIFMGNSSAITFLIATGVGPASDVTYNIQQHTASVSGTSAHMDAAGVTGSSGPTHYYLKAETALDNDESWVEVTHSEASENVVVGATYGAMQTIVVIHVDAAQLADGYGWVSLDATAANGTAHLATCLYILHDLKIQRKPTRLGNLLNPGAANA